MLLYSVYDKKAMCFFPPFCVDNKIQAIRALTGTVNRVGNDISSYPDDFALYYIGEFDINKAIISQPEIKVLECECRQLVSPELNGSGSLPEAMKAGNSPAAEER